MQDLSDDEVSFSTFEVIIIILFSVSFGIISGYLLTYSQSSLSRIRSDKNLKELVETYNSIIENYYEDISGKDLADAGIKGMVNSLDDPYSFYLDSIATSDLEKSVSGEYVGIGITVEYNDGFNKIVSVALDGPADKVGLEVGDLIIKVDDKDCKDVSPSQLNEWITGKIDTALVLSVVRDGIPIDFRLIRDKVEVWSVLSEILDENIGYIKIKLFSANSADQFKRLIEGLEEKNIKSLIIDVRDNPGGHISQVNEILNMFFKKKTVIYMTETDEKITKIYDTTKEKRDYPVVILVNGVTASSSEILVSSFKSNYGNVSIIGKKTYGKGTVQKNISLGNGSSIKYTVQKWYTANGEFIDKKGIVPDIELENDDTDKQLLEAISLLKK